MRIYDISLTISTQIPIWPGDDPPQIERVEKIAPVTVYPGSDDIKTLAHKGLAALYGEEEVLEY